MLRSSRDFPSSAPSKSILQSNLNECNSLAFFSAPFIELLPTADGNGFVCVIIKQSKLLFLLSSTNCSFNREQLHWMSRAYVGDSP